MESDLLLFFNTKKKRKRSRGANVVNVNDNDNDNEEYEYNDNENEHKDEYKDVDGHERNIMNDGTSATTITSQPTEEGTDNLMDYGQCQHHDNVDFDTQPAFGINETSLDEHEQDKVCTFSSCSINNNNNSTDTVGCYSRNEKVDKEDFDYGIMKQVIGQELICPCCLEIFVNAITLVPCGHSFCKTCVLVPNDNANANVTSTVTVTDIIDGNETSNDLIMMEACPTCRESITCTVPNRTVNTTINNILQSGPLPVPDTTTTSTDNNTGKVALTIFDNGDIVAFLQRADVNLKQGNNNNTDDDVLSKSTTTNPVTSTSTGISSMARLPTTITTSTSTITTSTRPIVATATTAHNNVTTTIGTPSTTSSGPRTTQNNNNRLRQQQITFTRTSPTDNNVGQQKNSTNVATTNTTTTPSNSVTIHTPDDVTRTRKIPWYQRIEACLGTRRDVSSHQPQQRHQQEQQLQVPTSPTVINLVDSPSTVATSISLRSTITNNNTTSRPLQVQHVLPSDQLDQELGNITSPPYVASQRSSSTLSFASTSPLHALSPIAASGPTVTASNNNSYRDSVAAVSLMNTNVQQKQQPQQQRFDNGMSTFGVDCAESLQEQNRTRQAWQQSMPATTQCFGRTVPVAATSTSAVVVDNRTNTTTGPPLFSCSPSSASHQPLSKQTITTTTNPATDTWQQQQPHMGLTAMASSRSSSTKWNSPQRFSGNYTCATTTAARPSNDTYATTTAARSNTLTCLSNNGTTQHHQHQQLQIAKSQEDNIVHSQYVNCTSSLPLSQPIKQQQQRQNNFSNSSSTGIGPTTTILANPYAKKKSNSGNNSTAATVVKRTSTSSYTTATATRDPSAVALASSLPVVHARASTVGALPSLSLSQQSQPALTATITSSSVNPYIQGSKTTNQGANPFFINPYAKKK
jgi:RING-type zinc-finger